MKARRLDFTRFNLKVAGFRYPQRRLPCPSCPGSERLRTLDGDLPRVLDWDRKIRHFVIDFSTKKSKIERLPPEYTSPWGLTKFST